MIHASRLFGVTRFIDIVPPTIEVSVMTLYIAGDGSLRYGEIVAVIDASKGAGVSRVGIITEGMRRSVR